MVNASGVQKAKYGVTPLTSLLMPLCFWKRLYTEEIVLGSRRTLLWDLLGHARESALTGVRVEMEVSCETKAVNVMQHGALRAAWVKDPVVVTTMRAGGVLENGGHTSLRRQQ